MREISKPDEHEADLKLEHDYSLNCTTRGTVDLFLKWKPQIQIS